MLEIEMGGLHCIMLARKFIHWLYVLDHLLVKLTSSRSLGMRGILAWTMHMYI